MKKSLTGLHLFQSKQVPNFRWRQAVAALFLSVGLSEVSLAQNKIWDKTLGGSKPDNFEAMVPTSDGGYLLGGSSLSGISGDKSQTNKGKEDYWIVKTDKYGKKIWDKVFGGSENDHLTAIVPTSDNGYLLGGYSASGVSGDKNQATKGSTDYWLVKIDATGKKLWDKAYGGNNADDLTALIGTPDGGFLLGGTSASGVAGDKSQANRGQTDYWAIKIKADGTKQWDKTYGGSNIENLAALVITTNGGYMLGGSSESNISGDKSQVTRGQEDYWVVLLNADGTKVWDKTYGGIKERYVDPGCNIETENCDRFYGRSKLSALVATPDGGYLLGGSSSAALGAEKSEDNLSADVYASDSFLSDYWVVKIDKFGNKEWDNTYGGVNRDYPDEEAWFFFTGDSDLKAILPTADGHYLLAGTSNSDKGRDKSENSLWDNERTADREDFWLIKIDGNGQKKWDKTIGGFNQDYLAAVLPAANGYIVGGTSYSNKGGYKTEDNRDTGTQRFERGDYWIVNIEDKTPPVISAWNRRYGGSGTDAFSMVIKTSDGGYLSGGYTNSGISGDKTQGSQGKNDYWIVKSDAAGKKLWDKRFGGSGDDYLNTIIRTSDGGYLLGGSSLSGVSGDKTQSSRGNHDYWVVKVSGTGVKQWDKRFGGSGNDDLKKVLQLANGNYLLAGNSSSPAGGDKSQSSQGGQDYWVIQINATGNKVWDKRYGGSSNESLEGLAPTLNGGFLLGGTSASGISGDKTQSSRGGDDYWLVRITGTGQKVWDKRFGGSGTDNLMDLGSTGTSTGNFYIAGHSTSGASGDKTQPSRGGKDFWMLKINGNGEKLFDKRFGGSQDEELRSIILTQDGGYLLAGRSQSGVSGDRTQASQGGNDYWIIKTSSTGIVQWDKRFGGNGEDELRTALQTSDGGYLLGGKSNSGVSGDRTQPSWGSTDYWLVKVGPQNTLTIAPSEVAEAAQPTAAVQPLQINAYPNPFSDKVTIRFTLPKTEVTTVKILDNQGNEVAALFEGEAQANQENQVEWKPNNQKSGIYLLQLQTSTKRQTFKLLLGN